MPRITLCDLQLDPTRTQDFMKKFNAFMKRVEPSHVGVQYLKFHLQVDTGVDAGPNSFDLVCETNKLMNQGSTQRVRNLAEGFIGGYTSNLPPESGIVLASTETKG